MKIFRLLLLPVLLALGFATHALAHDSSVGFSISFGTPSHYVRPPVVYHAPPGVVYFGRTPGYYISPHTYYRYSEPRAHFGERHPHQWRKGQDGKHHARSHHDGYRRHR